MTWRLAFFGAVVLFVAGAPAAPCRAETFVLASGGRIEGHLANPAETPRATYIVELAAGGRVSLAADQVERVETLPPAEQRYLDLLPRMPHSVDGLWKMAEWCRENSLSAEREMHLEELLALDPEHKEARLALGFAKVDGKWVRPEDRMRELGYVRFAGGWRLPQEVELHERKDRFDEAANQWRRDVRNLRSQVGKRRGPEAMAQLRAIRDPMAAPAIVELLKEEENAEIAALFVEVLGTMNHPAASSALTRHALENGDERIRELCLDQLAHRKEHAAVPVFIQALASKENRMVNRGAIALARMGDKRAVVPLIDALTTKHKQIIAPAGPPAGGIGAAFSPDGGSGGLSMGGKAQVVEREVENPPVLQALAALTSAHHGFNKAAWKAWYTATNTPQGVDLRREP